MSLDAIIDEAVDDMRAARPTARKHALDRSTATTAAPMVHGDPMRLVQVLTNLLSNAIKYTDPGGTIDVALGHASAITRSSA